MQIVELIPLSGIQFKDQTIALSSTLQEVEHALGAPYSRHNNTLYYFQNEVRFDFDKNERLQFIEFLAGIDGQIQPQIYGVSAFQIEADDLFDILCAKNDGEINDSEHGYSYGFLNISVGVFRSRTPEAVEDMIEDAEEEGEPMDEEDISFELQKATHWATIGIGVADYYR